MRQLTVVIPSEPGQLLKKMIKRAVGDNSHRIIRSSMELPDMTENDILFAVELNPIGVNTEMNHILEKLWERGKSSLSGSRGGLLVHSSYNSFTKTASQDIIYLANQLGCLFPGRPAIEANENLDNFQPMEKIYRMPLEEICLLKCEELGRRLISTQEYFRNKSIAVLHSSNKGTSNTLQLWDLVRKNLSGIDITEVYLGNGNITDCRGCSYKTCKYFGRQSKCFYGGIVVEEVYPAISNSSTLIMLCPNYNDMLTANIVATINRLTALFRKTKFYDKKLFSVIVSGYSGGDALAKQLISSLNMNKTFELPPAFSLQATANDPGSILRIEDIEDKAREFAKHIMKNI